MGSDGVILSLRLPTKKLHAELKRLAKQDNRSLNQLIVLILQEWITKQEGQ